jgi:hypothetical protein
VFESVVWYVMRFALADIVPLAGADVGAGATAMKPSTAETSPPAPASPPAGAFGLRVMGGGRFFELGPASLVCAAAPAGARRVGTGSGSEGEGGALETSSWSDLKLRFVRTGRLMIFVFVLFCAHLRKKKGFVLERRRKIGWFGRVGGSCGVAATGRRGWRGRQRQG